MKRKVVFKSDDPVFIIAELSANHNGDFETAVATIRAAKRSGADAIKFQTYTPDTITLDAKTEDFLLSQGTIWDGKYLHDLYKEAYTPWEWHKDLFAIAEEEGLICFSSPFDKTAVDFLENLDTPLYKIASFEITDIPLIEYVASKGKPVIISTGIATEEDIVRALEACRKFNNNQVVLLQCTSTYPASIENSNLIMIKEIAEKFDVMTGLSDHTMSIIAPVAATIYGAKVIEKHFIIDRNMGGVDSSFSLNEEEFFRMVQSVREAEKSIGKARFKELSDGIKGREFSRSLYIAEDVKKGDILTEKNVRSVRPGFGMHPRFLPDLIDKKFAADFIKGTRMDWNCIERTN